MIAREIMTAIEKAAPLQLQEEYDNAGLQCGNPQREVRRVLTCLDITEAVVRQAIETGCQMIVSHHPLLFRPVKCISAEGDYISRCLYLALTHDLVLYSAHTNLDNAPEGVCRKMGERLNLSDIHPLATLPSTRFAGLSPDFAANCGSGVIGQLPKAMSGREFVELVRTRFESDAIRINADAPELLEREIRTVALCGGSGSEFIPDAEQQGADVYLTGEIGYHRLFGHDRILLVEAGHYETEHLVGEWLRDIIVSQTGCEVTVY